MIIITVKYPSDIKIGNYIMLRPGIICEVIKIEKGVRHSRENGYPYTFHGKHDDIIYKQTFHRNVRKCIDN